MTDFWNAPVPTTASETRNAVARWMKIKFAQDNMDTAMYRGVLGDNYEGVVLQLQNDAMHSGLLGRLLAGQEPEDR